jgi:hypothetical protein
MSRILVSLAAAMALVLGGCASREQTLLHEKHPKGEAEVRALLVPGQEATLGVWTKHPALLSGGHEYGGEGIQMNGVVEALDAQGVTINGKLIPYADIATVYVPYTTEEQRKKNFGDTVWAVLTLPFKIIGALLGAKQNP